MDVHIMNSQRSGRCACNKGNYVLSITTAEIVSTIRLKYDIHLAGIVIGSFYIDIIETIKEIYLLKIIYP